MEDRLAVDILGPLEVRRGGHVLEIEGAKRRQLLAVLVAARGGPVTVERLCEVLWALDPPPSARASLQSHVSRLRAAIGAPIVTAGSADAYRLDAEDVDVDAARFDRLVEAAIPSGDAERLERALALWRGPGFGAFADLPGVRGEARRLEELRLTATEALLDARIAAGQEGAVIGELEALVTAHPLRERFWRQLMLALHLSGRQAEALRRCGELRSMLRDDLGLDPSTAVQQLEAQILCDDPVLARRPDAPGRSRRVAALAHEATSLVGRDATVEEVLADLASAPVVTICGPGGVGKTRLALRVAGIAQDAHNAVVVVELAPLRDPKATIQAIARALDVEQRQHRSLADTVEEYLADKAFVLVLDNCEHVLDVVAALVDRLRRSCPGVTVLSTSREPLGLPGEHVHVLAPLEVPAAEADTPSAIAAVPAVELFVERARSARPGFSLTDRDAAAVAEICRRLDGLPLALELAAARVRTMSPQALAERLEGRFALLDEPNLPDPRHRTLHQLVTWSYDLLSPAERDAFAQLSVFAGGFSLDAAEAVCVAGTDTAATASLVVNLVDKSMVQLVDPEEPRYRLLETLRDHGRERLRASVAIDAAEARHRHWFVQLAERAAAGLDTERETEWVTRIDRELDDLRAAHASAVGTGDLRNAARLVVALREFAFRQIRYEITGWADVTTQMDGFHEDPSAPEVLAICAYGHWVRGDLERSIGHARRARELAAGRGDEPPPLAERVLGNALFYGGRTDEALQAMSRMRAAAEAGGAPGPIAHALYMCLVAQTSVGALEEGTRLAAAAEVAAQNCGSPTAAAQAAYARGLALRSLDAQEAERAMRRAADLGHLAGNRWIEAFASTEVHWLTAQRGDLLEGLRGFAEVIGSWYRGGDWANQWLSLRHVFGILVHMGAHEAAAVLHGALIAVGAAYALPFAPADAERLAAEVEALKDLLPAPDFAAAVRTGAAMSDSEIVAFVQREIDRWCATV